MLEIAGYQIGNLLGRGAFGETYEAVKGGQRVALKLIKEEAIQRDVDVKRFQREVRAIQKAVGLNVVKLLDSGVGHLGNEIRYFIALEYLEGKNLADAFKISAFEFDEITLKSILIQIVDGLETVHNRNIIHRDLKPANIFLTTSGEIKLLDFGLVKMLDYTTLTTRPGQAIGTPLYIAPEILQGHPVDFRADFYSLGILIFHLITGGNYPFSAGSPFELYARVINEPPKSPTKLNGKISSDFENLVLNLLSKQPFQRFNSHADLRNAIENTSLEIIISGRDSNTRPSQRFPKRWFFNLLNTEGTEVENYINSNGKVNGFIYPAHFLPKYRKTLGFLQKNGIPYLLDPSTPRFTYSTFTQTKGIVNLPYLPDKNNVLVPSALSTIDQLQKYSKGCLDWQIEWKATSVIAPYHFCRDINSEWLDIDIKLIEESVSYAKSRDSELDVLAGICLNIESYTDEQSRIGLLNRYSRVNADGYIFYVDEFDEKNSNPIQISSYLELMKSFQQLGKPVVAGRVGTLGLGFLAAGVDAATSGITSLTGFSENNLLRNRTFDYKIPKKYYIPELLLSLPFQQAQDILRDPRNANLRCNCVYCKLSAGSLDKVSKRHFLQVRSQEVNEIQMLLKPAEQLNWFNLKVEQAIEFCNDIRKQQLVDLKPSSYAHLRVWKQVFSSLEKGISNNEP